MYFIVFYSRTPPVFSILDFGEAHEAQDLDELAAAAAAAAVRAAAHESCESALGLQLSTTEYQ